MGDVPGADGPIGSDDSAVPDDASADQAPDAEAAAEGESGERAGAVPEWERRRRMAEVFGDVLPETTGDERGGTSGRGDEWYRRETPPHHGS